MKSMTGYAFRESASSDVTVSVEIKGYNSRFLDLSVYLPSWLSSLEPEIRAYAASRFARGKVEIGVRVKEKDPHVVVTVNEATAHVYEKAIKGLAKFLCIKEEPGLAMLLGLEGVLETEIQRDAGKYRALI